MKLRAYSLLESQQCSVSTNIISLSVQGKTPAIHLVSSTLLLPLSQEKPKYLAVHLLETFADYAKKSSIVYKAQIHIILWCCSVLHCFIPESEGAWCYRYKARISGVFCFPMHERKKKICFFYLFCFVSFLTCCSSATISK